MKYVLSAILLTFVYTAVLASFDPLDFLTGLIVSSALLFAFRGFLFTEGTAPERSISRRLLSLPLFVTMSVVDVVKGTWEVALVVLGFRKLEKPGIVAVPIGDRSRIGLVVSSIETTLSPGTYLVEIDRELGVWYIHVLDARDPDSVRRDREHFYREYQRGAFP